MYNRYIPEETAYIPAGPQNVVPETRSVPPQPQPAPPPPRSGPGKLLGDWEKGLAGLKKKGGVSALLKNLKLGDFDSGDILLLLIILFLLAEGDDLELVIALGLVLIMGLNDKKKEEES